MKTIWQMLFVVTVVQLMCSVAFALQVPVSVPITDQQAGQQALDVFKMVHEQGWWVAIGPIVALSFFYVRKYDQRIPKIGPAIDKFMNLPLVAMAMPFVIATAGAVGHAISAGQPVKEALATGAKVGGEAIVTYVFAKQVGAVPPAPAPEPTAAPAAAPVAPPPAGGVS